MIICAWICLIIGVFNIIGGLVQKTKNIKSAMFYTIIPFFMGLSSLLVSGVLFNIIKL
jgi:hypothetical protein